MADEPLHDEDGETTDEGSSELAPMDFSILVLSLNTSALVHLGEAPAEVGPSELNLPMARQTIDMIAMLEEKTKGNLTGQEERLVDEVLFDLRMRYARKAK